MDTQTLYKAGDDFPFADLRGDDYCAMCNKKLGKVLYGVEVVNGGTIHDLSKGAAIQDGGYLGFFRIGSECAKKFESGLVKRLA